MYVWLFSSPQGIMAPYIPTAEVGMKLALTGTVILLLLNCLLKISKIHVYIDSKLNKSVLLTMKSLTTCMLSWLLLNHMEN